MSKRSYALARELLCDPSYALPWPRAEVQRLVISNTDAWQLSGMHKQLTQKVGGSDTLAVLKRMHRASSGQILSYDHMLRNEERIELLYREVIRDTLDGAVPHRGVVMRQLMVRYHGGDGYMRRPAVGVKPGVYSKRSAPYTAAQLADVRGWLREAERCILSRLVELGILTKG